jgi:glycosyltransferase involved in cell wall biosynthesis
MRILLVSPYFPPQNAVASLRTHAFASWWARAGEDVTVLTTVKRSDQRGLDLDCDGFKVVEVPFDVPSVLERVRRRSVTDAPSGARRSRLRMAFERRGVFSSVRMPDLTDFWVRPARKWCAKQDGWDAVVSSSGPYTAHLVARSVHDARHAAAWVADFRDLWVDNTAHPGLFPFTVRERILERGCLDRADRIATVSTGLARLFRTKFRQPIDVIYNGFEPTDRSELAPEPAFPNDGIIRLVYTGTIYPPRQDPASLLEALRAVGRGVELVIAGRACDRWDRQIRAIAPDARVTMHGEVSREQAMRMQRDADALLLVDWDRPDEGMLTGKLFEYLNATAPILVVGPTSDTPVGEIITRSRRGVHLSNDIARIEAWLRAIPAAPTPRDDDYIAQFTRETQSIRLLEQIRALVDSAG